ncbi:Cys-tRNA(Pro)/Cys-tRNA(Cys) deacylase [Actinobaculum suis]|uniref:Cys-tRNA(Pro)/Cys-tRNA(Cys) deacylase n=1 Tax=Actinobaculum suis TaxID=1657 RepID=A0A0K9ET36_9ACTO|nr:Cys-tRNA(Pro) deacylase [Actinobaculum suis]KMY23379.1 prolyl-tRNA synthetase [Actinobaculum suis]MDY5152503.1 Cys-tRNA(Pro) deacylase [Actinobaculum suis]SDE40864.1 Cys-tRNA(Pro)/Cys-tRNA(Cys) deacylase [Actinobaculum suis]
MAKKKRDRGRSGAAGQKPGAAATPALQVLEQAGVPFTEVEYEHAAHMEHGYALDSAQALGLDPATVFKTLLAEVDGKPVVAVVPANAMLNLKALAKAAGGKKGSMMDPAAAERRTGYVTGGISPLGQKITSPTFIDESARELEYMLVSGGKRTLSVKLAPADLVRVAPQGKFAAVADFSRHF